VPRSDADAAPRRSSWLGLGLRGLVLGCAVVFLVRGVKWHDIAAAAKGAGIVLPSVVIAMNACMMGLRALRLRVLLERRLSFKSAFVTLLTSSALNNIAPFRGGHVARLWMMERASGVSKSAALAITLVENLLEVAILALLGFVASWLADGQTWAVVAAPLVFLGTVALLGLLLASPRYAPRAESAEGATARGWQSWLRRLLAQAEPGLRALCKRGAPGRVVLLSLLAWLCEATMILLCAHAMGLTLSFPLALIVLFGINLALTLPSTPASAGPFEGATVAVLLFAGIAKGPAVAFAFFYHAIQVVPVTVAGATVLLLTKRARARMPDRASAPASRAAKLEPS
jgi:glycosyltransferase 2 family protein